MSKNMADAMHGAPIKVMMIISAGNVTGPVKGIFQLIENSDSREVDFHLYGFRCDGTKEGDFLAAACERGIPVRFFVQRKRSYLDLVQQVVREIREERFAIVQTHGYKPTFLGFFARMFCRVKWVCFMHGTTTENLKARFYNFIDNILQTAADRTVLVSHSQRRLVFGGRNLRRVQVVHNAVDLRKPMPRSAHPQPLRERFAIPDKGKIVAALGRFSPEKGMDVLLDAFALLAKRECANVHLVLVGDGQQRSALERQCSELRIDEMVHFAGYSETPGDLVAEADVLALPSRSEGIPNVALEAMALGKPVVATAVGGVPEIIEDGVSGRLVPSERPDLMACALGEVLNDTNLYRRLAAEGNRRVAGTFGIRSRVSHMQALYGELV